MSYTIRRFVANRGDCISAAHRRLETRLRALFPTIWLCSVEIALHQVVRRVLVSWHAVSQQFLLHAQRTGVSRERIACAFNLVLSKHIVLRVLFDVKLGNDNFEMIIVHYQTFEVSMFARAYRFCKLQPLETKSLNCGN
jgi:hypothetical protein